MRLFGLGFGVRRRFWAGFWCAVRRFWAGFWCAVCGAPILGPISVHGASFLGSILVRGAPFLGSILVRGVWCADFGADFGARCAFLGSFLVCGAPFLGSILVHGVWCADFGADFVARCAFLGSILARCLFGIDFALMLGSITASGQQEFIQIEGNRARDLSNMGPWSWRMMPFWVDFGARCAFSGWVLVCGAPFLG